MSDSTNVGHYKRLTRANVGLVHPSDSANVGLRKKIIWLLRFLKKALLPFIDWCDKSIPTKLNSWHLLKYSSLYLCNLVTVLTFDTFKLKLFDLVDFIDWNIKGFTTSGCKDIGILKHQSLWQLNSTSFWSVVL